MEAALSYLLVLLAYLPGLIAATRMRVIIQLPVVLFCFLGMFFFNAAGSILVMTRHYNYFGSLLSFEYVMMLVLQPLLFYMVTGPYVLLREPKETTLINTQSDKAVTAVLVILCLVILAAYFLRVGRFLAYDLLSGTLKQQNVLEYRMRTYGLPEYPIYRLGFLVFPILVAVQLFLGGSAKGRFERGRILGISLCLMPPLLLGEKAGVLNVTAALVIAYSVHLASLGRSFQSMFNPRLLAALAIALIPTLFAYSRYYRDSIMTSVEVIDTLLFRMFGVYSEALAAIVPFSREAGELGGTTLPNIKGLLPFERINLEAALHHYMTYWTVEMKFSGLPGSLPVPALGEGYVNFGWPGFIIFGLVSFGCVVLVQEIFLRFRFGTTSYSLMVWYGYLAMTMATTGLFATFVSLIHTVLLLLVFVIYLVDARLTTKFSVRTGGS